MTDVRQNSTLIAHLGTLFPLESQNEHGDFLSEYIWQFTENEDHLAFSKRISLSYQII